MSALPPDDTPFYNHPLHQIEEWLEAHDCGRSEDNLSVWHCDRSQWQAVITLAETQLQVLYTYADGSQKLLSFPYSLSRADMELAVFAD